MSTEVQDLILQQLDDIRKQAEKDRALLLQELRKLDEDFAGLRERIIHIEHEAKTMRWIFAGAGGVVALILREVIPIVSKIVSDLN